MGRIIAVDFDGTLCANAWPHIGEPNNAVIQYIIAQKRSGAEIILWTNREGERLQDALKWCESRGIAFDAVNENLKHVIDMFGNDTRKIYADEYLDDKNVSPREIEHRLGNRRMNFRNMA